MPGYILLEGAAEDLRHIVRYTRKRWDSEQARTYAGKLRAGIQRLIEGRSPCKSLPDIHPSLRVARCESHYIFWLWRNDEPALIIAILHEKMDLIARISERFI